MLAESGQMLTTDRTSIRRRLAIRGTAHTPPWSRRKAGHRSIVAPLAATIAAALALRAGVTLARVARESRAAEGEKARRRIGIGTDERLGTALQRMALGQLELAIEMVERVAESESPERSVHEARKALKRLRALIRLLAPELGEQARRRENDVLRAAGEALSAARDADILLSTLDGLVETNAGKLAGRSGVMRLRAHLRDERERAWRGVLGDAAGRASTLSELRAARARLATWRPPDGAGVELVQPGLVRVYRQGRSRLGQAADAHGDPTHAFHRWRKRVKDLRYATEMLRWLDEDATAKRPGKRTRRRRKKARRQAAWLRRTARRADELGELLGEEHDLAMLEQYVRGLGRRDPGGVHLRRGTRRKLVKLIAARRRRMRKQALRRGERLYRRPPGRFARRAARAHTRSGPAFS
jgi:CHAD domain-containing protein